MRKMKFHKETWMRGLHPMTCWSKLEALNRFPCIPFGISHCSDFSSKPPKLAPLQERKMVDRFRLWAKGGDGGNGCWSFRRSRHDPYGKPDGGNGGKGGDVILECSAAVWDFSNLQHHLNASKGGNGVSKNKIGKRGKDKVGQVPVGTVVHLVEGDYPSFLESKSTTSLNPWETSGNEHNSNDHAVGAPNLFERQDVDDSYYHENIKIDKSSKKENINRSSFMNSEISRSSFSTINGSSKINEVKVGTATGYPVSSFEEEENGFEETETGSEGENSACEDLGSEFFSEMELKDEVIEESVAEFTEPGQQLIVSRGGGGGLGNASLGKVSKNHRFVKSRAAILNGNMQDSEDDSLIAKGTQGSQSILILELKSIADVGLVGMPNVGKSTLLGAISRAKPAVGDYAFTTLRPNIGNLNYDDFFSVTVADIPGLIKGAHENRGLGHAFLRHIERTKVLAYVVDLAATLDGKKGISPWEQLRDLVLELEYYQAGLSDKPSLIVANKIDEEGAPDVYEELKRRVPGVPIYPVCAILEEGITELKSGLRKLVDCNASCGLDVDAINIF